MLKLRVATLCVLFALLAAQQLAAQPGGGPGGGGPLPPMPAPPQNPLTPQKAILGKILFWDEQLSSDNTVACGSCHLPEAGGSDPRVFDESAIHPGLDQVFGTADDVVGSVGVHAQDCNGVAIDDGVFFPERQATGRKTPSFIGIGYFNTLFWEGRATNTFRDPLTNAVVIPTGGSLESQALEPILSSAEMSCDTRTWADVTSKLAAVSPMALAVTLTPDMESALLVDPTYPELFQAAFGTPAITPVRIGFAIASYERTLVPNQTPLDQFLAGNNGALTPSQQQGRNAFNGNCGPCHGGPILADGNFHNVGVRPGIEDIGREEITGNPNDRGRFRTPPLRNVGLRAPYFHNGGKATLTEVVTFYRNNGDFNDNLSPIVANIAFPPFLVAPIVDFLENALTDPRVAAGLPPFDHPTLRPYFRRGDSNNDGQLQLADALAALSWLFAGGALGCADAADCNDDGVINISDPILLLQRLFLGGDPLPAPTDLRLGPDPTLDLLDCATGL